MNKKITIFALGATILVGTAYINADITSYLKYPWTRMKNYFNEAKKTQQIINNKLKNLKPQIKRAASLTNYIEKIKDKKIENLKNKHLEKMIDIKNPLIKEEQKLTQLEKQLKSIKNAPISTKREKRKALKTQKTNLTTEIKNEKKSIKTLNKKIKELLKKLNKQLKNDIKNINKKKRQLTGRKENILIEWNSFIDTYYSGKKENYIIGKKEKTLTPSVTYGALYTATALPALYYFIKKRSTFRALVALPALAWPLVTEGIKRLPTNYEDWEEKLSEIESSIKGLNKKIKEDNDGINLLKKLRLQKQKRLEKKNKR